MCQIAAGLQALGLGRGDHIALICPNTPHFVLAYYAILKLGAVVVPLNVLLKPREIAYHLQDSDAKALLVFEGTPELPLAQMAKAALEETPSCRHLVVMTVRPDAASPVPGAMTLGQVIHRQPTSVTTAPTGPGDTAVILYTSGTTGQSKGAELTHLNMTLNAMASRDMLSPALDTRAGASRRLADHAAAVSLDRSDGADERRHRRRLDARAAAALRSRRGAARLCRRAGQLLGRRADDVLDAVAARAQPSGSTSRRPRRRCAAASPAARRCRRR